MKTSILLAVALFAFAAILLMPGVARAVGERVNDLLFGLMARTGGVLGMADISSREATRLATTGGKLRAASSGKVRASIITGPDVVAWAQNDTCGNRDMIPPGARFLGAYVNNAALGASVTMNVGIRAWTPDGTGAVITAALIVSALDVSGAVNAFVATGSGVAAGAESVTTVPSEPYFTLAGANPTDDADIRVTVLYVAA